MSVVVAGGGWAGLSAAVELTRHGIPVTLLEAAGRLGGRARDLTHAGLELDNGQHLLLGACKATLALVRDLGLREGQAFLRRPLDLRIVRPGAAPLRIRAPRLPAPLHLLAAIARAEGLSGAERRAVVRLSLAAALRARRDPEDLPVSTWLALHGQSRRLTRDLWTPLCVAALNTPVEEASSRLFARVLAETLGGPRRGSDLLVPARPLGAIVPGPALRFLTGRGARVLTRTRVTALETGGGALRVRAREARFAARDVVLAVPPPAAARLLAGQAPAARLTADLARLEYQPVFTAYLRYAPPVRLDGEILGLSGLTGQWVFDRAVAGQPGLIAVVISARGPHLDLDNATLGARLAAELARLFPRWPAPIETYVIRERRATFSAVAGVDALRPGHRTPVPGLWLAGDYTATGYPATLEGAVRSGIQCATEILERRSGGG